MIIMVNAMLLNGGNKRSDEGVYVFICDSDQVCSMENCRSFNELKLPFFISENSPFNKVWF